MAQLNRVFLMGNLTRDPQQRFLPSGQSVVELGLATNRKYTAQNGEKREEVTFVDIEVRILRADAAGRAAVLEPLVAAPAPVDATAAAAPRARALTAAERTALLAKLAARPDLEQIESPRLLASPLQLAEMSISRQFAVVRSYRCTVGADGKPVVDPVVEQLVAGNRVALRAMPLGKAAIGVAATLRHAAVQEPIPETTLDLGTGAPLRVQLPAVTEVEASHTAAIEKDGALLLLLPLPDGGAVAALVTAHIVRA